MSISAPRDPAEHDEPVDLAQAIGDWADAHPHDEPDEPEADEYDPGPEVDDRGGMSEYDHYARWQEIQRAEDAEYAALQVAEYEADREASQ